MDIKVKFVDFPKTYSFIRKEILKAIDGVLSKGNLVLREDVEEFEKNLAKEVGAEYAVGVNSGTDALLLSLKALGIKEGDDVITSGYTFWATVEAIIHCGANPVLAEIGDDLLIDPDDIERKITQWTKAIIPVHIGGNVCDMEKIKDIADRHNLKIIEDSAQAIKGEEKIQGDTSCYSFFPAKILGGYGDGGAIATNSKEIMEKLKLLRAHGGKHNPQFAGYNSRLDNLQAAILNIKLKYLDEAISKRRQIGELYDKELEPIKDKVGLPTSIVYQEYNLRAPDRDKLYDFLKENGIETIKGQYPFPIEQPEKVKKANEMIIRLPIWTTLKDEQIKYVTNKIKEFYGN